MQGHVFWWITHCASVACDTSLFAHDAAVLSFCVLQRAAEPPAWAPPDEAGRGVRQTRPRREFCHELAFVSQFCVAGRFTNNRTMALRIIMAATPCVFFSHVDHEWLCIKFLAADTFYRPCSHRPPQCQFFPAAPGAECSCRCCGGGQSAPWRSSLKHSPRVICIRPCLREIFQCAPTLGHNACFNASQFAELGRCGRVQCSSF